jgi:hypothetical protein
MTGEAAARGCLFADNDRTPSGPGKTPGGQMYAFKVIVEDDVRTGNVIGPGSAVIRKTRYAQGKMADESDMMGKSQGI